eukprot:s3420_g13.t1
MFSVDMDDTPELPVSNRPLFRSKRALALDAPDAVQLAPGTKRRATLAKKAATASAAWTEKPATEGSGHRQAAVQGERRTPRKRPEFSFLPRRILSILREETVPPPRPVVRKGPNHLQVGSACSGLCTELFSLADLRRNVHPVFYCESDSGLSKLVREMHEHDFEYKDVFDPSFGTAPYVDLLFAGFPCQGFSSAGSRTGEEHPSGLCVVPILQYIHNRRPRAFCLENVKALTTEHREFFGNLLQVLVSISTGAGEPLQHRCRSFDV